MFLCISDLMTANDDDTYDQATLEKTKRTIIKSVVRKSM